MDQGPGLGFSCSARGVVLRSPNQSDFTLRNPVCAMGTHVQTPFQKPLGPYIFQNAEIFRLWYVCWMVCDLLGGVRAALHNPTRRCFCINTCEQSLQKG